MLEGLEGKKAAAILDHRPSFADPSSLSSREVNAEKGIPYTRCREGTDAMEQLM